MFTTKERTLGEILSCIQKHGDSFEGPAREEMLAMEQRILRQLEKPSFVLGDFEFLYEDANKFFAKYF